MNEIQIILIRWVLGLTVSLLIGQIITKLFLEKLRNYINSKVSKNEKIKKIESLYISRTIVGLMERTFFTPLVAFNVSGTAIAMIGWVTIKMFYNWQIIIREENTRYARSYAFSGLFGNLCSMFFALIGGIICGG